MTGFVILSSPKPIYGDPCNGCGSCCQNEACFLSLEYLKSSVAPCIALEWDATGHYYRCGLASNASRYLGTPAYGDGVLGALFAKALGFGEGCDSDDRAVAYARVEPVRMGAENA